MRNAIVWACKEQTTRTATGPVAMDYSPAEGYGDLRFITRTDLPMHASATVREVWEEDVVDFVKQYDPARDFIITTGQPTAIFAIGWALGNAGKAPRFLVWRREDNAYRVMNSFNPSALLAA